MTAASVADVLAAHQSDEEMGSMWCNGCDRIPVPHSEHVAEQITAWLIAVLISDATHELVVRRIYGDGLDQAHNIANAAIAAVAQQLTGGAA